MGSFNTSCFVSRTPIDIGDNVKLFFIASPIQYFDSKNIPNFGFQSFYEPYDLFKIIGGLHVNAYYNDYGEYLIDETSENSHVVLKEIQNYAISNVGSLIDAQKQINNNTLNLKTLSEYSSFYTEDSIHYYEFSKVSIVAVHEDIYNTFISSPFYTQTKNKLINFECFKKNSIDEFNNFKLRLFDDLDADREMNEKFLKLISCLGMNKVPYSYKGFNVLKSIIGLQEDDPKLPVLLEQKIMTDFFCVMLGQANIPILPPMSYYQTGGTDKCIDMQEKIIETIKKRISK